MEKEILKELKELNKTTISIKNFIVAQVQLTKSLLLEIKSIKQEVKKSQQPLEEKA